MDQKPTPGRIVLYTLPRGPHRGEQRPAMIVKVWSDTTVNLQVLTDGANDGVEWQHAPVWVTSAQHESQWPDNVEGTWSWPQK